MNWLNVTNKDKGILFTTECVEYRCLDCKTNDKPTIFRREICKGNLTGHEYSNKPIKPDKCDHKNFDVDQDNVKSHSQKTGIGTLTGMLTAGWVTEYRHYFTSNAQCRRCLARFNVQTDYHTRKEWVNYKQEETIVIDGWTICYKKTTETKEVSHKEIDYIK